jgi:hypothetical protein
MPAYVQHREIGVDLIVCPNCLGLPMYVRDVEPHWSMAKIDFTYECFDCGTEVRQTVIKPERQH